MLTQARGLAVICHSISATVSKLAPTAAEASCILVHKGKYVTYGALCHYGNSKSKSLELLKHHQCNDDRVVVSMRCDAMSLGSASPPHGKSATALMCIGPYNHSGGMAAGLLSTQACMHYKTSTIHVITTATHDTTNRYTLGAYQL